MQLHIFENMPKDKNHNRCHFNHNRFKNLCYFDMFDYTQYNFKTEGMGRGEAGGA